MAVQIKQYIIVLLFSFSFSFCAFSQETESKQSLSEILSILEQRYKVQFNYAEDAVSGILVEPPKSTLSLKEALSYLEIHTDFQYQITEDNMILVIANKATFNLQKLSEVMVSGYIVKGINKLSNGSTALLLPMEPNAVAVALRTPEALSLKCFISCSTASS